MAGNNKRIMLVRFYHFPQIESHLAKLFLLPVFRIRVLNPDYIRLLEI